MKLVADRLGLGEQLVNEALRGAGRRLARRRRAAGTAAAARRGRAGTAAATRRPRGGRAGAVATAGGGRDRFRGTAPPPEPVDPRAALARREQSESAFLAYCLALPEEGERRLAAVDVDDYFSAPATRQAAAYLRGRLRTPAASLPAGDESLARLVAELVVRSGALEATPAKLELEALQLDLHRLERHISERPRSPAARPASARSPTERQKVLDEIRHRLT